jgi:hypothetical protein
VFISFHNNNNNSLMLVSQPWDFLAQGRWVDGSIYELNKTCVCVCVCVASVCSINVKQSKTTGNEPPRTIKGKPQPRSLVG